MPGVGSRLMLLDAASLYFRAFFGVPETTTAPDGTPVNAVRGFLDMVAYLVAREQPARGSDERGQQLELQRAQRDWLAVETNFARLGPIGAEDQPRRFGAPRPYEAGEGHDFAAADRE